MKIKALTEHISKTDAITSGVVYNGGVSLGIKFLLDDDDFLIVDLSTDKAELLAHLILDSIERGKIV